MKNIKGCFPEARKIAYISNPDDYEKYGFDIDLGVPQNQIEPDEYALMRCSSIHVYENRKVRSLYTNWYFRLLDFYDSKHFDEGCLKQYRKERFNFLEQLAASKGINVDQMFQKHLGYVWADTYVVMDFVVWQNVTDKSKIFDWMYDNLIGNLDYDGEEFKRLLNYMISVYGDDMDVLSYRRTLKTVSKICGIYEKDVGYWRRAKDYQKQKRMEIIKFIYKNIDMCTCPNMLLDMVDNRGFILN